MQHCTRQFLLIEFFIRKFIYEIRTKCHSNSYLLRNLIDKQKKDKKKQLFIVLGRANTIYLKSLQINNI